ncbi:MAG: sugar ABC transporter ATP-binding protein [Frankia sp.]|nr:sugar ABC transporter ATP-binding protein [Frankia sp.]
MDKDSDSELEVAADGQPEPLLTVSGVVKQFPGVRALDGVDLTVRAGEVHCLLGQNGAGKSTLIKVLSGAHQPDAGTIRWRGAEVTLPTPTAATRLGIATIYQELDLVDGLSVADNIFLGHELARAGLSRRRAMNEAARALLARLGHADIPVTREAGQLSAAGKQVVSMARALSYDARLIIMDEPSAVLDADEVDNLFRLIQELTANGVAVIYISHRLAEIRRIGDRVTVLKDGRTVARGLPARTTPTDKVIRLMTGRAIEHAFPPRVGPAPDAPQVLRVDGLGRPGEFSDISFSVRAGEVVGLAGLVGSGRSEILETIYGARRAATGEVVVGGRRLRRGSVGAAVAAGVGLCPEERKSQGLLLDTPVYRNITLATMARFAAGPFTRDGQEAAAAGEQARALDIRPPGVNRPVRTLSGGNQQKVVLARWLLRQCRVLLLDEPTRGVDVGARDEIYQLIRRLARSGVAIVLVSSEVPEVIGLADRVLVIAAGRLVRTAPATDITESQVLDLVMEEGRAA